jgi:hypothetical protein
MRFRDTICDRFTDLILRGEGFSDICLERGRWVFNVAREMPWPELATPAPARLIAMSEHSTRKPIWPHAIRERIFWSSALDTAIPSRALTSRV